MSFDLVADEYFKHGFEPLPLPPNSKHAPPNGTTGNVPPMTKARVDELKATMPDGNTAVRLPDTVIGIDVDDYGGKHGGETFESLISELGALPPTWVSSSREGVSGIRLFRVPAGARFEGTMGEGIDVIQHTHRYMVCAPSMHPDGRQYQWTDPDGDTTDGTGPRVEELPQLPDAWLFRFILPVAEHAVQYAPGDPCLKLKLPLEQAGSRHDAYLKTVARNVRYGIEGHTGAEHALAQLREQFVADVSDRSDAVSAAREFDRMVAGAVAKIDRSLVHVTGCDGACKVMPVPQTSTAPVDLGWATDPRHVDSRPRPQVLQRADGHHVFYQGKVNGIYAAPETGKSWVALIAVTEALSRGKTAAFVDLDHNGSMEIVSRLRALGVHNSIIADPSRFRYYEIHESEELVGLSTETADVVVLDSIGEALPMLGFDSNSADQFSRFHRAVLLPWAFNGCCVIVIDHTNKSEEQTGWATGTAAKKRVIDGIYLHAVTDQPIRPGDTTAVRLFISKDRTGSVRAVAHDGIAAVVLFDASDPEHIEFVVDTPEPIDLDSLPEIASRLSEGTS
jgi:hypothetical protein